MYKHGFTLGKFMPPHNGHLHLIREAKKRCEFLTVLVCSLKAEPIEGKLRHKWLIEIFKDEPNIKFVHVTDEVPQTPEEDVNFWPIWVDLINRNVNMAEVEVFFSSEHYGDDVADHLDIDHICIDLERITFPVSGTKVRNNPFEMWEFLHPIIRPYFVKRIVLTGAESVGKSTMIKLLAKHYNTNFVEEYGRAHCEKYKPIKLYPEDFVFIAVQQQKNENEAAKQANKILFCDTDGIVTEAYSRMYNGTCPVKVLDINRTKKYDLHILLDADLPFVDDGTRVYIDKDRRVNHTKLLEKLMIQYGTNYKKVGGIGEERFKNVVNVIDEFLNT